MLTDGKVIPVNLEISSFRGISIGAVHFYGTLKWKDGEEIQSVDLQHKMNSKEVKAHNLGMQERGFRCRAKRGDPTTGFASSDQIVEVARKKAAELFPDGEYVLVLGRRVSLSAQPILFAPKRFLTQVCKMNQLAAEWGRIGNCARAEEIDDEWLPLFLSIANRL